MQNQSVKVGAKISNLLDQSHWYNDVTHKDLQMINKEIDSLIPEQRNYTVARLSDSELETWADEMESAAPFGKGGLTDRETKDLFDDLAKGLDATQLKRVYSALGDENKALLSQSIADKASDQTKSEFISGIADLTTAKNRNIECGPFISTADRYNHDAKSVSNILASIDGSSRSFTDAVNSLNDDQLDAVLTAATEPTMMTTANSDGRPTYFFKTDSFSAIADRVAESKDAQLQGRFFEIGTKQIANIRDTDTLAMPNPLAKDEAGDVAKALSKVLNSNVTGIVTELEEGTAAVFSEKGRGMSSYLAEMMRQGDIKQIYSVVEKLKKGNDLQATPNKHLKEYVIDENGDKDYQNLNNMGYMVGAVRNGVDDINADAQEKADLLCCIFGLGFGVAGQFGPTPFKIATTFGNAFVDETLKQYADDVKKGNTDFADVIELFAFHPFREEFNTTKLSHDFHDAVDIVTEGR